MQESIANLKRELSAFIPAERLIDDPLRRLAFGTDASFYRLTPELVVRVDDEEEVRKTLLLAGRFSTPVTFRAAGTSVSGQAVTDSVLLALSGDSWRDYGISEDAGEITLQPGIIGAQVNEYLAPYNRKIGPDPASINAAKIGGIAANNSSGMCCGTAQNSYNTLVGMRLVLADGTLLDTGDKQSVTAFRESHKSLLDRLSELAAATLADDALAERIRHKYRLKNTNGYSLNALVDFQDPVDILQHLMIGSEGTLGFISEITYRTVPDHPCKATALILFPDIERACNGVAAIKPTAVTAVELMDRASMRSVEEKPGMPGYLRELDDEAAALLVDVRGETPDALSHELERVEAALSSMTLLRPVEFTHDQAEYQQLWNIRKDLFPAVGSVREQGTTVIVEDIAFPVPELASAVRKLQALFKKYEYHEAIIFGHALEGNLHFVFTQDFGIDSEVRRYQHLMDDVCNMVVGDYNGSLKAEHGTGRNMAPYVELEWGSDAYRLMWELKGLFDPKNLLNPGVILNEDEGIHLKNLKPMPAAEALVDKCTECGFCEAICPSRDITFTPRQRILSWREINRLRESGDSDDLLQQFEKAYTYQGTDTCAADGLCATRCPIGIDTGKLIKKIRSDNRGDRARDVGNWVNNNFSGITSATRTGLKAVGLVQGLLGDSNLQGFSEKLNKISGGRLPQWKPCMPRSAAPLGRQHAGSANGKVVYFPSCVSRTMGPAKGDPHQQALHEGMQSLLVKAGFETVFPARVDGLCCGQPLDSKGLPEQANESVQKLEQALWFASEEGRLPVLCDTSPCTFRMIEGMTSTLKIYEPVGFINEYLLPHLKSRSQVDSVALHVTCTSRKLGLEQPMLELARRCAKEVVVPEEKGCCGFAGDKGFTTPELNASALKRLREQIPEGCSMGVSNSRTCEIGLSEHSGVPYQSIVYLVDHCFDGES